MDCRELVERLYGYLDQESDGITSAKIAEHLEECRHCCTYVEFERHLLDLLEKEGNQGCAVPSELGEKVLAMLRSF